MVWLTCVGSTGDGIWTVEVAELMRRRWFDGLDLVGRSARGVAWSSSRSLLIITTNKGLRRGKMAPLALGS